MIYPNYRNLKENKVFISVLIFFNIDNKKFSIICCIFVIVYRLFFMKKIVVITTFVFLLLAGTFSVQAQVITPRGDVNQDGSVNISDITSLIDYLLSGSWPEDPLIPDESEYVDLGLPSGTLWATRNVGARTPEDYGDYFAWGETSPKDYYCWSNYKWCNNPYTDSSGQHYHNLTKYCTYSNYGYHNFRDGKTELDLEDDAAYVNWGASWRLPTTEQQQELVENCTWTITILNGVYGRLFTGPNGNTIFLPTPGEYVYNTSLESCWLKDAGEAGYYWSRTLCSSIPYGAYEMCSNMSGISWRFYGERYVGKSVRAVRVP